ncbi:helix-turn-helix domain-containing protein [Chitinophaga niabensis]|uniref:HTH cro/C1-type domain-containing protein n=1 Tax=Chitinophaga niabensis TaxID=536979 RepID=A0A1N6E476_9BACT|nr:helix-turn-helix transcriptional regulator [Chitinophaga niabensis]SIN77783.1 hypothetical protein SAMN04488055_1288 [Chitinophaga niabensis]
MGKQEDIIQAFAEKLKAVYMQKGISMQDLELSDADKTRLENILKGEYDNVDVLFLVRIADSLGVPPYSLLK